MISRVCISYSKDKKITYSFWKYFFQACGIWVEECEINENWSNKQHDVPHLIILGNNDGSCILSEEIENRVYLLDNRTTIKKDKSRKDVIKMERWEKNKKIFSNVIGELIEPYKERQNLQNLLEIFIDEELWGTLWLYHEIAFDIQGQWNKRIEESCEKAIYKLTKQPDEWHFKFLKLYCEYVKCGISVTSLIRRSLECDNLLQSCEEMAKSDNWNSALCILAAKICGLSPVSQKNALNYYKSVLDVEENAETAYNVGRIYQKIIGDYDTAFQYYEIAFAYDNENIRAVYKVAINKEKSGDWIEAYLLYSKIREKLSRTNWEQAASIREIEYYYKSTKKLIRLSEDNINVAGLVAAHNDAMKELSCALDKEEVLGKILYYMFGKSGTEIKSELIGEIRKRIFVECKE